MKMRFILTLILASLRFFHFIFQPIPLWMKKDGWKLFTHQNPNQTKPTKINSLEITIVLPGWCCWMVKWHLQKWEAERDTFQKPSLSSSFHDLEVGKHSHIAIADLQTAQVSLKVSQHSSRLGLGWVGPYQLKSNHTIICTITYSNPT